MLLSFPLWGSGSGTYVRELAQELSQGEAFDVGIVCPEGKGTPPAMTTVFPLEMPFLVAYTGHPDWPGAHLYENLSQEEIDMLYESFLASALHAVEFFKPDIIHVHHVSILLWVAEEVKKRYAIPYIVTSHGTDLLAASKNNLYISRSYEALEQAECVLPVSKDTQSWLVRLFKFTHMERMHVAPGGTQIPERSLELLEKINTLYGLAGKKVVVFSGKLTKPKGVSYLIEAAKHINGEVYVIGDGPERHALEHLAAELNIQNVHFLGYFGSDRKDELVGWYQRADVVVAPSVWDEPLPLVVLEAMGCGTPVVATQKGGIPSVIQDGVNGLLVPAASSEAIAWACGQILQAPSFGRELGIAAQKIIQESYTWESVARRYDAIYRKTLLHSSL